jgi:aminopeptidase-like protein
MLQALVPLTIEQIASGTPVLDWQVPNEWNIREAWIETTDGTRLVDFRDHNLHVVGYSQPIRRRVTRNELVRHLHTLPNQPDLIPYRTAYYADTWGFCVPHALLEHLDAPEYDVCIDATLAPGELNYGEYLISGRTSREVLVSCHICHPSLCNDNLSAITLAALLARELSDVDLRYSYRFVFVPGTIGAITWLARNDTAVRRLQHGLVLTCLGDSGGFTYKRSRRGDTATDRIVAHVLAHAGVPHTTRDFSPYGYDERQYCSPGFNLPVGRLSRACHGEFPQYHTSADNLDFVTADALGVSYALLLQIVEAFECNRSYLNLHPRGEPQLGRRGLYGAIGGIDRATHELAMLWVLNQSDGRHSLLDIATRADLPLPIVATAARLLESHGLLAPCEA